jgi:hypothetical protein
MRRMTRGPLEILHVASEEDCLGNMVSNHVDGIDFISTRVANGAAIDGKGSNHFAMLAPNWRRPA